MSTWVTVVAQPSEVTFRVRVDARGADVNPQWDADVAVAVDSFVYELCDACGYDIEDHVVVPGPFGKPFIRCEKGEDQ